MNRIKDKLAESVRQARSAPAAAAQEPKPVAKSPAGAARKPAQRAVPEGGARMHPAPGAVHARVGGEPPASAGTLFPGRVWPD
jgi:hypothetical protein